MKVLIDQVGSAEKLARLSGMSSRVIGKYLSGDTDPSRERLIALARAAGVTVEWLATGEGMMRPGERNIVSADHAAQYVGADDLDKDYVLVPRYDVKASAGGGTMIHSEQIVDHLVFKAEWVHNALGVSVRDLALISVKGDSMEPTLSNGDLILIDISSSRVEDNAIYVLQFNDALLVKRIQRKFDGSVVIKSDNQVYEPETLKEEAVDQLNVIGRVVWCGRRM